MAEPVDDIEAARVLVARERHGVLSTAHAEHGGWPFGSVTPYALSDEGDPILLLSGLAEHTRNLRADPRASLLVQDSTALDRPQAAARVALLCRASIPVPPEADRSTAAYLARFPEARGYLSAHDFFVHVLRVEHVRWIAGFGSMGWLERREWARGPQGAGDPLAPHAREICDHMNEDHPDALLTLAAHAAGTKGTRARMTGIDAHGFDVAVEGPTGRPTGVRIPFDPPVTTPEAVRKAMMAMLAKARTGGSRGPAA